MLSQPIPLALPILSPPYALPVLALTPSYLRWESIGRGGDRGRLILDTQPLRENVSAQQERERDIRNESKRQKQETLGQPTIIRNSQKNKTSFVARHQTPIHTNI
eukprot:594366-Amorphochlora_amoeboformis.AAC.1